MSFIVRNPILLLGTILLLVVFGAALATESSNILFWGKSTRIWSIALVSLAGAATFGFAWWRAGRIAKFFRNGILMALISAGLLEAIGFLAPRTLPVGLLLMTPSWVQDVLPREAFDRSNFRIGRETQILNHPTLAYKFVPNLDIQVLDFEIQFHRRLDRFGFANNDDTLYADADVVVTGDSFTMADTVELADAWPRILSESTGARVLNLATAGWHTFQYPAVLEAYAMEMSPDYIFVTLTGINDTWATYNAYEDYRSDGGGDGWIEFSQRGRVAQGWATIPSGSYTPIRYVNALAGKFAPFTFATAEYLTTPTPRVCEFDLNGQSLQFGFLWDHFFRGEGDSPAWVKDKVGDVDLERVGRHLNRVVEIGAELGAEVRFIYLPLPEEIYIPVLEGASNLNPCASSLRHSYRDGHLQMDRVYLQYEEALGNHKNLLIDATPILQKAAARGENLAWVFDTHPNEQGHYRIAELVAKLMGE